MLNFTLMYAPQSIQYRRLVSYMSALVSRYGGNLDLVNFKWKSFPVIKFHGITQASSNTILLRT